MKIFISSSNKWIINDNRSFITVRDINQLPLPLDLDTGDESDATLTELEYSDDDEEEDEEVGRGGRIRKAAKKASLF